MSKPTRIPSPSTHAATGCTTTRSIFHDKPLGFNLSQFKGAEELYGAYHQVRDTVLAGVTPVVFWDEFDSREFFWLQRVPCPNDGTAAPPAAGLARPSRYRPA